MTAPVHEMTPAQIQALLDEFAATRERLADAEAMLSAIRHGDIDGLVVAGPHGDQVFTLKGTDYAYRAMIEAMEEGTATLGADGAILFCNRRFAAMLRLPHAQVLGAPISRFLSPESQSRFTCLASACRGQAARGEVELVAGEGTVVPVSLACSALPDGESASLCIVATDLTIRKAAEATILQQNNELEARVTRRTAELRKANATLRAEIAARKQFGEALRESKEKYQSLFQNNTIAMLLINPETGRIVEANRAAVRYYAYPYETLLQMTIQQINTLPDTEVRAAMAHARSAERQFLFRHRLATGEMREVEVHSGPVRVADTQLLYSMIIDITARKQAEEALRESEARFRTLVQESPDGIIILNAEGCVVEWNAGEEGITGIPRAEALGQPLWELQYRLAPPAQRTETFRATARDKIVHGLAEGLRLRRLLEDVIEHPDGQPRVIQTVLFGIGGEQTSVACGICRDITEHKQFEHALLEADRAKDEFLAVLSHELQTPLVSMLGWSAEALRAGTPELLAEAMPIVHRNAVRQKRLVDELLEMSRLIHQKTTLNLESADLLAQAGQAVENIRQQAEEQQLRLVLVPSSEPLPIHADPARLQQCLANLLSNSLKFTPAGGTITVSCRREDDQAVCCVEDTGRGISPDALPAIFQVFHQVDRNERYGGLGLGLAVTHGIITLHGGGITAESDGPNCGSRFTFTLPIANTSSGGGDAEEGEVTSTCRTRYWSSKTRTI